MDHFLTIMELVHQEDLIILNMCAYNIIQREEWISHILGNESVAGDENSILGIKENRYKKKRWVFQGGTMMMCNEL